MTFKQLLGQHNWLNIEATLLAQFPEKQNEVGEYENVYQTLLLLPASETDLRICLQHKTDENTGETEVEVVGHKQNPHITHAQLSIPYALPYTPWAEWLAMPIASKCFQQFSGAEIIVYCLLEMTTHGFDEETIQASAGQMAQFDSSPAQPDDNNGGFFMSWEQIIRFLRSKE